mmetsp:Transcript_2182/g.7645  ORF Transcript_2182/g.7645 Transcript_2182/m.7645 type:complete len:296 (-) Transcript_2182:695-1582(-)
MVSVDMSSTVASAPTAALMASSPAGEGAGAAAGVVRKYLSAALRSPRAAAGAAAAPPAAEPTASPSAASPWALTCRFFSMRIEALRTMVPDRRSVPVSPPPAPAPEGTGDLLIVPVSAGASAASEFTRSRGDSRDVRFKEDCASWNCCWGCCAGSPRGPLAGRRCRVPWSAPAPLPPGAGPPRAPPSFSVASASGSPSSLPSPAGSPTRNCWMAPQLRSTRSLRRRLAPWLRMRRTSPAMKGWSSSAAASARSSGFLTRHTRTKSLNCELHLEGSFTVGLGFMGIMKMARMGCTL